MSARKPKPKKRLLDPYMPSQIVVQFRMETSKRKAQSLVSHLGRLEYSVKELNTYVLYLKKGIHPDTAIKICNAINQVLLAERCARRRPLRWYHPCR